MPYQFATARDLFEASREASRDAERIKRQLDEMERMADGLGSPRHGQRVSASADPGRMASRVASLVDVEERLRRRRDEDYAIIDVACSVLYGTESDAGLWALCGWRADAIYRHYLCDLSWERVGRLMGYSGQHCRQQAYAAMEVCDGWGMTAVVAGRGCAE